MKKFICFLLLALSVNMLSAEYKWNNTYDNIILASSLSASALIKHLDDIDSVSTQNRQLNYKINFIDKTALDNWSPRSAKISDALVLTQCLIPITLLLNNDLKNQKTEIALIYFETISINTLLSLSSKSLVKRNRPYVYNKNTPENIRNSGDSRYSFFSAHSSTAFAASFFTIKIIHDNNLFHNNKNAIYTGLISSSALTAYLRFKAGKHFPSDIFAGALVGTSCGLIVPELHKKNNPAQNSKMLQFSFSF